MPIDVQTARQILNKLFQDIKPVKHRGPVRLGPGAQIPRGSVIRFQYRNWKHDPYPVVIVSSMSWAPMRKPDGEVLQPFIKGINLNYLTPFDFKRIIRNCGNPAFSYMGSIRGDMVLRRAFRYYLIGFGNIVNLQMLDCQEIMMARDISKAYDPNQIDAIKQSILKQLEQQANVKASELTATAPVEAQPMEAGIGEAE
jgi:hypothetical protein